VNFGQKKQARLIHMTFAFALAACASTSSSAVPPMLRGCWTDARGFPGETVTTQSWTKRDDGGWTGEELSRAPPGAEAFDAGDAFELRRTPNGFELCETPMENLSLAPACLEAFFGPAPANRAQAARWEFDVGADHLRLTRVSPEDRGVRFDGRREPCPPPLTAKQPDG
jgi:hypothetical protein